MQLYNPAAGSGPLPIWTGGRESYATNTPALVVGAFSFDKSRYTSFSAIKFRALGAIGDTTSGLVELYNVTDASSVSTLTFTTTAQALKESADIQASLPASAKIYEVRIYLNSAPAGSDSVELYSAALEIIP